MLPPYAALLGLAVEQDQPGAPVLAMPFARAVVGRPGFVHGGAIAGLLEMAAVAALRHALAGAEVQVKPITVTTDFMRGGREKLTRARGTVTRLGTRIANVEAIAWQDAEDRPIAFARMNCLLVRSEGS